MKGNMRFKVTVYNLSCAKLNGADIEVTTGLSETAGHVGGYLSPLSRKEKLDQLIAMTQPLMRLCTTKNPLVLEVVRTDGGEQRTVSWERYAITPQGHVKRFNEDGSVTEWHTLEKGFEAFIAMVDAYMVRTREHEAIFA